MRGEDIPEGGKCTATPETKLHRKYGRLKAFLLDKYMSSVLELVSSTDLCSRTVDMKSRSKRKAFSSFLK